MKRISKLLCALFLIVFSLCFVACGGLSNDNVSDGMSSELTPPNNESSSDNGNDGSSSELTPPNDETEVVSISISDGKRVFPYNEDFSYTTLVVTATYDDASQKVLGKEEISVNASAFDKTKAGEYTIVVSLVSNTEIKAEYTVKVLEDQENGKWSQDLWL